MEEDTEDHRHDDRRAETGVSAKTIDGGRTEDTEACNSFQDCSVGVQSRIHDSC